MSWTDTFSKLLVICLMVALTVWVAFSISGAAAADSDTQTYYDQSEAWCEERGGDLWYENAFIHGGLHCQLPNGSVVHMNQVVNP